MKLALKVKDVALSKIQEVIDSYVGGIVHVDSMMMEFERGSDYYSKRAYFR